MWNPFRRRREIGLFSILQFQISGNALKVDDGYMYSSGPGRVTIDTFAFDGFHFENQIFLEATTVELIGLPWDDITIIYGIAGLTPSSTDSILSKSTSFMFMVKENALDRNPFRMRH